MKNVVTIGGAKGQSQVLKGMKNIPGIQITGICPSTDSGGSTGVLQKEYGGSGYTGDLTRCAAAFTSDEVFLKSFMYRYEGGALDTHLVRNIWFHALEKTSGHEAALSLLWKICGLGAHRVLPVSLERAELCATLKIGNIVSGETHIDNLAQNPLWNPDVHSISHIYMKPEIQASTVVVEAIDDADYIVICPGDLYTSILPSLLPLGMKDAIVKSTAPIILILNCMTKKGETDNYKAEDFIFRIETHLGRKADYIIANNGPIPEHILLKYSIEAKGEVDASELLHDDRIIQAPMAYVVDEQVLSNPEIIRDTLQKIFL